VGTRHPQTGFVQSFDDTVAVTLRFPANRLTQFNLRYYGGPVTNLVAVGSKGSVMLDPSYMFGQSIQQTFVLGQDRKGKTFKNTDHFGSEMKYFSDCILNGTDPEPGGDILCFGISNNDLALTFQAVIRRSKSVKKMA
jgi:predicted dehydrogenase